MNFRLGRVQTYQETELHLWSTGRTDVRPSVCLLLSEPPIRLHPGVSPFGGNKANPAACGGLHARAELPHYRGRENCGTFRLLVGQSYLRL